MKKIIRDRVESNVVCVDDLEFKQDRVYILVYGDGDLYKLQWVGIEVFTFVVLDGSGHWSHGGGKAEEQIKEAAESGDVYEFNDFDEFVQWYIDQKNPVEENLEGDFLPDSLRAFLIEEGCLDDYLKAFEDGSNFITRSGLSTTEFFKEYDRDSWIFNAFGWSNTKLDFKFWYHIDVLWRDTF